MQHPPKTLQILSMRFSVAWDRRSKPNMYIQTIAKSSNVHFANWALAMTHALHVDQKPMQWQNAQFVSLRKGPHVPSINQVLTTFGGLKQWFAFAS